MKKLILPLFLLAVMVLLSSCSNSKSPAIGNEDDIIVFADSMMFYNIEPEMLHVFEKIIYTPQPENLFNLKREDLKSLGKLKKRKNIIFLGTLDSDDKVSQYIKSSLDSSVTQLVKDGKDFFFNKKDLWAKDQLVMFLTSENLDSLRKNILSKHEELLYSFRKISNERLFAKIYKPRLEKREIEAKLLKNYDWMMYIQPDVELARNDSVNNFVWLRAGRNTPIERWVFVHWVDNANTNYLSNDSLISIRNRLTEKFFHVDDSVCVKISNGMSKPKITQSSFDGRYALMCQGFWSFTDKSGGGPFISYSFLDENTGRFYMVDASIFAPKYYKKKLLQRADVILNSFRTVDDLSKERKEEILDALE